MPVTLSHDTVVGNKSKKHTERIITTADLELLTELITLAVNLARQRTLISHGK